MRPTVQLCTLAHQFLSKMSMLFDLRNRKFLPFSLLGNLIVNLFLNVLSRLWRKEETLPFC